LFFFRKDGWFFSRNICVVCLQEGDLFFLSEDNCSFSRSIIAPFQD